MRASIAVRRWRPWRGNYVDVVGAWDRPVLYHKHGTSDQSTIEIMAPFPPARNRPPSSGHAGSSGNCDVKHNHRLFLLKSASEILSLANNAAVSLSQTHTKLNAKNPKRETFGYFYRRYTVYILHASRFIAQW